MSLFSKIKNVFNSSSIDIPDAQTIYFKNGEMYKVYPTDKESWYDARYLVSDGVKYDLENLDDLKGNLLLDQIRQYTTSSDSTSKKYCYHALLIGKEQHGYNKISNLNTLSDIIYSLNDLKGYMQSIKGEKNRAVFLNPATAFFEVNALDQKEFPEQKRF